MNQKDDYKKRVNLKAVILFCIAMCWCVSPYAQIWKTTFSKSIEFTNQTYNNGMYKGQLNNGTREGLGVYYWAPDSYRFGYWSNNKRNGYGIYLVEDGYIVHNCNNCTVFVGNWSNDEKNGQGTCYDSKGNLIYYGKFANDKALDPYPSTGNYSSYKFQTISYTNGDKYVGETQDGARHGYGIYIWSNGNLWYGYWKQGSRDGIGILLNYDGSWVKQNCIGDNCSTLASSNNSSTSNRSNVGTNIGQQFPDITLRTPEGKLIAISDYAGKGKYVLLDFWAAWCGPCRRANPHVVELYKRYKNKGFEIVGISLDQNKDAWIQAIKDDRITWPQMSDLGGWQNAAAQLYSVHSIPYTVLLDKNGKIIAKELYVDDLIAKLAEIFDR